MIIGNREFYNDRVYVMGILNVTPDSFSDGGCYNNIDSALKQVEKMIAEGADIIDIGGESTRPGYTPVGESEELTRLLPVIKAIKERFNIIISVDTYHSAVAREAANCGVDMINDIWGLNYSGNTIPMACVVKDMGVSVCIMHNSNNNYDYNTSDKETGTDMISQIISDINTSVNQAKAEGIPGERIMIDPGVGFAKSYEANMAVIANLSKFNNLGYPVLLGTSNKSCIGLTLDLPVTERLEGTMVTSVLAVLSGCRFVRVHDVGSNVRAIRMAEAIMKYKL